MLMPCAAEEPLRARVAGTGGQRRFGETGSPGVRYFLKISLILRRCWEFGGAVPNSSPLGPHRRHPDPGVPSIPPLTPLRLSLPFPQTIPSTSPRSPFSPATTPAAASGSRTPRSPWCRWSGRSWPRSAAAAPGSGSAGGEQPQDGSRTPRVAREPRNPRDGARGGRRRAGLVLPARRSPGSCRRVKSPSPPPRAAPRDRSAESSPGSGPPRRIRLFTFLDQIRSPR